MNIVQRYREAYTAYFNDKAPKVLKSGGYFFIAGSCGLSQPLSSDDIELRAKCLEFWADERVGAE